MGILIDSSLWVDYFRAKTPLTLKQRIMPFVESTEAVLCEPVCFAIRRGAMRAERRIIEELFATFPVLATPPDVWQRAARLGQQCLDGGLLARSMDLLITVICLRHEVTLVTFDSDFAALARYCPLKVQVLSREITTR